jgi:hypothetical protein
MHSMFDINSRFCLIISKRAKLTENVFLIQNICFKILYNVSSAHFDPLLRAEYTQEDMQVLMCPLFVSDCNRN